MEATQNSRDFTSEMDPRAGYLSYSVGTQEETKEENAAVSSERKSLPELMGFKALPEVSLVCRLDENHKLNQRSLC